MILQRYDEEKNFLVEGNMSKYSEIFISMPLRQKRRAKVYITNDKYKKIPK